MANNKLNSGENILVKVDQNNLIYIDPNSVVNNGVVEERGVKQENLVMYVNLEADLIPRTTLVDSGNKTTLVSVAKGTLNILKPKTGDFETFFSYLPVFSLKEVFVSFSIAYIYGAFNIPVNGISFKYAYVEPTNVVDTSKLPFDSLYFVLNLTKCKRYLMALP